jgi:hypothetical protein
LIIICIFLFLTHIIVINTFLVFAILSGLEYKALNLGESRCSNTLSIPIKKVVLDKIWVKHWEYKS